MPEGVKDKSLFPGSLSQIHHQFVDERQLTVQSECQGLGMSVERVERQTEGHDQRQFCQEVQTMKRHCELKVGLAAQNQ